MHATSSTRQRACEQPDSHGRSPRTPRGLTQSRPWRRRTSAGRRGGRIGCAPGRHRPDHRHAGDRAATCSGSAGRGPPRAACRATARPASRTTAPTCCCCGMRRSSTATRSNVWLTYKQAASLGAQVRRGEKAVLCAHFERRPAKGGDRTTPSVQPPTMRETVRRRAAGAACCCAGRSGSSTSRRSTALPLELIDGHCYPPGPLLPAGGGGAAAAWQAAAPRSGTASSARCTCRSWTRSGCPGRGASAVPRRTARRCCTNWCTGAGHPEPAEPAIRPALRRCGVRVRGAGGRARLAPSCWGTAAWWTRRSKGMRPTWTAGCRC